MLRRSYARYLRGLGAAVVAVAALVIAANAGPTPTTPQSQDAVVHRQP